MTDIQLIAQEAGVSTRTAARVLSGEYQPSRRMARSRAEKILEVARQRAYRVNSAARAMASGRQRALALLMSEAHPMYLPPELLFGLESAMHDLGQHLVVARLPARQLEDSEWMPRVLREVSADGLLLHGVWPFPEACEQIVRSHNIATVRLNACFPVNAVYPDDLNDADRLTGHLLEAGHRRVAYMDSVQEVEGGHYSVEHRRRGYERAMGRAGMIPQVITVPSKMSVRNDPAGQPADVVEEVLRRLRSAGELPTAFITYAERIAGPLAIAAARLGLSSPSQLSLATFSSSFMPPLGLHLTQIQIADKQIAQRAVAMLLRRIEEGRDEPSEAVGGTLLPGATVAAPQTPHSLNQEPS